MRRKSLFGYDMMKAQRRNRALILVVLTIFVMTLSTCLLSACNQEYEGDKEYGVYVSRVEYDKYEDDTVYARVYLGLTSDDSKKIEGLTANWHYEKRKLNAFKFGYVYRIEIVGSIFSAAVGALTQEQRYYEETEYNTFEVYFEYATIYKSMKGEINRKKVDGGYAFDFAIEETQQEFHTTLSIDTQNSAIWYGLLVAVAVSIAAVVIALLLARRKRYAKAE